MHVLRIYGEPMQWRSPTSTVLTNKHGRLIPNRKTGQPFTLVAFSDKRVDAWIEAIKQQLVDAQFEGEFPEWALDGPIFLELWIYLTRPKSNRQMYPDRRPDRTNFLKSSEDGLCDIPFDDGQVVDGPVHLRWAYYHYPADKFTEQEPGLIFEIGQLDTSERLELNKRYRTRLKQLGLEYVTKTVGKGKKEKTVVVLEKTQPEILQPAQEEIF